MQLSGRRDIFVATGGREFDVSQPTTCCCCDGRRLRVTPLGTAQAGMVSHMAYECWRRIARHGPDPPGPRLSHGRDMARRGFAASMPPARQRRG